jgi:hypothetical protein
MKKLLTVILMIAMINVNAQLTKAPDEKKDKPVISALTNIPTQSREPMYNSVQGSMMPIVLGVTFIGLTVWLLATIIKVSK